MANEFINVSEQEQLSGDLAAPGVWYLPLTLVNICFIENKNGETKDWVVVDGGMGMYTNRIMDFIDERFGKDNPPKAIILTHGHFDHVGALTEISDRFRIPIYAHEEELP